MNTHKLNVEESKRVYRKHKDLIKPNDCYRNIFNLVGKFDEFDTGDWRIAYGYMPVVENIYVRHCFIVNENDEVIDPTVVIYRDSNCMDYLTFSILGKMEYIELLLEDQHYSLSKHFMKKDLELTKEYFDKGIALIS